MAEHVDAECRHGHPQDFFQG